MKTRGFDESQPNGTAEWTATPGDLARLLGELAALPHDQRQAIAKLLIPAEVPTAKPSGAILDERCALDDRKPAT